MKIIVDAMGGDNAPMAPVEAAVRAVKEMCIRDSHTVSYAVLHLASVFDVYNILYRVTVV